LTFAEGALLRKPDDTDLADLYTGAALKFKETNRARDFLKRKLGDRPVCIPWHRAYQSVEEFAGNLTALEDEYAKAVKREPTNAALAYLNGRVVSDYKRAEDLYRQASRMDPSLPCSWYALAHIEAGRGNWKACLEMLSHIPKVEQFSRPAADLYYHARLGSGQAAQIEAEFRKKLERAGGIETLPELTKLIDAQMAQGKTDDAKISFSNWENRLPAPLRRHEAMNSLVRPVIWYYLGDFARIKNAVPAATLRASPFQVQVLLATGDTDALLKRPDLTKLAEDNAELALDLGIAFQLAKNPTASKTWCETAAGQFDHSYRRYRQVAEMLRANSPPKVDELTSLTLDVSTKCRMAALLAARFPQQKEAFAQLAGRLNVSRQPPFYLVQRAIQ
jgi:tetratricopeptide (TPR) repeat protein